MEELYRSYLSFLRSLDQGLVVLTDLAEKKRAAAEADDLMTLNELLNQDQAQSQLPPWSRYCTRNRPSP